jgi:hypothetical protein
MQGIIMAIGMMRGREKEFARQTKGWKDLYSNPVIPIERKSPSVDSTAVTHSISEEVLKLKKRQLKTISTKQFNKIVDKICVKLDIDESNPLNETIEDSVMGALEKNKIKVEK